MSVYIPSSLWGLVSHGPSLLPVLPSQRNFIGKSFLPVTWTAGDGDPTFHQIGTYSTVMSCKPGKMAFPTTIDQHDPQVLLKTRTDHGDPFWWEEPIRSGLSLPQLGRPHLFAMCWAWTESAECFAAARPRVCVDVTRVHPQFDTLERRGRGRGLAARPDDEEQEDKSQNEFIGRKPRCWKPQETSLIWTLDDMMIFSSG